MNDPELIRLGFIGAGGICEQRHLPNLTKMPGVELVAVCNRSPESSRRVQEKWGFARTVDDWRQIIEASDIDAVFIGTWPYRHCELSLAALAAGKHVFCQRECAWTGRRLVKWWLRPTLTHNRWRWSAHRHSESVGSERFESCSRLSDSDICCRWQ